MRSVRDGISRWREVGCRAATVITSNRNHINRKREGIVGVGLGLCGFQHMRQE